jgi:deoxyribodipyrimidine photo-lyase
VGNDPRHNRVFNALRQAREYDPEAQYVSLWLPELRDVPQALRHTPFLLAGGHLRSLGYPQLDSIPESWKPYLHAVA